MSLAFVLVITHHGRAGARQRRTIRRGHADRLNTGLLVIGDDGLASLRALRGARRALSPLAQHRDSAIDAQDFRHLGLEFRIALLQVIAHPRSREGRLLCGLTA
jgi:hypothetical protein